MDVIFSIAKKEIMDNFRNAWIIFLSVIFAVLAIVISYFGSQGFSQDWSPLESTISTLEGIVILIIPIIGLMLGYASIVGEIEKGSMSSLISLPVNSLEIIIGKFLGLGSVISSTIFIGLGISGLIIAINAPGSDYITYISFIGISILLGLVFLSIAMFFSTLFKKRSTAMAGAIFIWFFFAIIWQIILGALLFAIYIAGGAEESIPGWFYPTFLANPLMIFIASGFPEAPSIYWRLLSPILWIIIPLFLAYWIFKKRDV
ncbi:MAG: ABC transporter permease subunit [Thermoplasmatales archaeon]|nr:MAG: ABC transporter permease subunit [Thermoplasmatales archaeon]